VFALIDLAWIFGAYVLARGTVQPRRTVSIMAAVWLLVQIAGFALATALGPSLDSPLADAQRLGRTAALLVETAAAISSMCVGTCYRLSRGTPKTQPARSLSQSLMRQNTAAAVAVATAAAGGVHSVNRELLSPRTIDDRTEVCGRAIR
jgi:hypothetical protein